MDIENELNILYNNVFQRNIDQSGLSTYLNLIKNGKTINDIKLIIQNSDEYKSKNKEKLNNKPIKVESNMKLEKYIDIQLNCDVEHYLDDLFTVVITNWKRIDFLWKCFLSVIRNNIKNIVITTASESSEHICLFKSISEQFPYVKIVSVDNDFGCNKMWLSGLYQVKTRYVLVLHDDDELSPHFNNYLDKIKECMLCDTPLILWDGKILENGIVTDEYHSNMPLKGDLKPETGTYQAQLFHSHYKTCIYPISPVVQIMQTEICIKALNECESYFKDPRHFTKPTMMIGNEIMMTFRNLESGFKNLKHILYIHDALTYYGRHPGSESEIYMASKSDTLKNAYIFSRNYIHNCKNDIFKPNFLHITNIFCPKNENDIRRHKLAFSTWKNLYNNGDFIPIHINDSQFDRNSTHVGDKRSMPFIHDIINLSIRYATDQDICILTNADICLTTDIKNEMDKYFKNTKHECGFCFRYDCNYKLENNFYNSEDVREKFRWYVGSDLFAFKVSWWRKWSMYFPDFIIGKPCWDWVMRDLMSFSIIGVETFKDNLDNQGKICDMGSLIYHEKHESYAELSNNYFTDKANLWNWILAKTWFKDFAKDIVVDGTEIFENIKDNSCVSKWLKK
jgi:hypothetical protein